MTTKPTLVFLHYFGGAAQSWKQVTDLLSADYHCIAIDMPGFGGTPALAEPSISAIAQNVAAQLAERKLKRYTLIGHSMGGKIALQLAADLAGANSIEQLLLLAPSPPSVERMPEKEQKRTLIHPDLEQAKTTVKNSSVKALPTDLFDLGVNTQLISDDLTWQWWIKEGINHSIAEQAKKLELPITLIISKDDPAVTYQMTTEDSIPNLPPHTRLVSTNGIGHLYPLEDPVWTANCLRTALQSDQ